MAHNLPREDAGSAYCTLPEEEQAMLERGQLGRKSGGGYYRMRKSEDGSRMKEVYVPESDTWRLARSVELNERQQQFSSLVADNSVAGQFAGGLMLSTCAYAADLVPEISDDTVNIDRAMRWGFNWAKGPFQLIDDLLASYDLDTVDEMLSQQLGRTPAMLAVLKQAGVKTFYSDGQFLGRDGHMHALPPE
jgi:3-hydroxyacyl-CoA dehydrogenase